MSKNLPIQYRDFYDFPRVFLVEFRNRLYLFDCSFDDELDDYRLSYVVYVVDPIIRSEIGSMSWEGIGNYLERIAELPTGLVKFDESRRSTIDAGVFEAILNTDDIA